MDDIFVHSQLTLGAQLSRELRKWVCSGKSHTEQDKDNFKTKTHQDTKAIVVTGPDDEISKLPIETKTMPPDRASTPSARHEGAATIERAHEMYSIPGIHSAAAYYCAAK